MKIALVSDLHGQCRRIRTQPADLLIVAGDITTRGELTQLANFNEWLAEQPQEHKVAIAGNHDLSLEPGHRNYRTARSLITAGIYLDDSGVVVNGLKIWGSPIQPEFMSWAFNRRRGADIKRHWDMIPEDTDILITHGPPYGILDTSHPGGQNLGCLDLRDAVDRIKPKLHVFGHIHGGRGVRDICRCTGDPHQTMFVNASVVNESYRVVDTSGTVIEMNPFAADRV